MPTVRATRQIDVSHQALWEVISDPHHLPRWWPRVTRVEDVDGDAFTEVMRTSSGHTVRADFHVKAADRDAGLLSWDQRVQGTPFGRLLKASETEIRIEAQSAPACVTIVFKQSLNGVMARFGSYMVRRAATATVEQALDGLERILTERRSEHPRAGELADGL